MAARRLTKKQRDAINHALDEFEKETGNVLVRHATAAAIAGDAAAQATMGKISWDLVNQAALDLVKSYAAGIAKGGSTCIVDGKPEFVPWLSDSTAEAKTALVQLIEDHITSGGGIGAKEGTQGYQPGSLSDKLSEFFDQRKSHASAVARTEMSKIRNDAAIGRYRAADVERMEYLCGADPCEICAPDEGQVFAMADFPYLPRHVNCSCGAAPVIEVPK